MINLFKMYFNEKLSKLRSNPKLEPVVQFILFGLVGVSNTLISYLIYVLFVSMNVHFLIANGIGFIVSVLNSFYWNNRYVFINKTGKKRSGLVTLFKTFIAYGFTGILLNSLLLIVLVEKVQVSKYGAPLIVLLVTIPLNFIINKRWSFKVND